MEYEDNISYEGGNNKGSRSTAVKGKKHFPPPFPIDPEMENTKTQTVSQI